MDNIPRDQSAPRSLPDAPPSDPIDPAWQSVVNNIRQLEASDGWDLAKKWFEAKQKLLREQLGGLEIKGADLQEVGAKFLVCDLVASHHQEFINWIETNARAEKEADEQRTDKRGAKSRRAR